MIAVAAYGCLFLAAVAYGRPAAAGPEEPAAEAIGAVLDLSEDGFIAGGLVAGGKPRETILWRSPAFTDPFEFSLEALRGIRFPLPVGDPPKAAGDWRVELFGGDTFVGAVETVDDASVAMTIGAAAAPTQVAIRRDAVRRLSRGDQADFFTGPAGLTGWVAVPRNAWRQEAIGLTGTARSTLLRRIDCGPRCRYDLALSWRKQPSAKLSLASRGSQGRATYEIDLGPAGMLALRQEQAAGGAPERADLERFGDLPDNRVVLAVFVDQKAGRLAVMLPGNAKPVADLTVAPAAGATGDEFRLQLRQGSLAVEQLRVSPWLAADPIFEDEASESVRLPDGTVFEPMSRSPDGAAGDPKASASLHVVDLWGSQFSGELERVDDGGITISHAAIEGRVSLPIASLARLASLRTGRAPGGGPGPIGRIECDAGDMAGCLVAARPAAGAPVAWQPVGSFTGSPLAASPDGGQPKAVIDYGKAAVQADGTLSPNSRLVLRTGETLPCIVESIDEAGVRVRVKESEPIVVAHDVVQAVELVAGPPSQLSAEKFRSLTTLPRSREQEPPTHVVRSMAGDYLRGRLVSIDGAVVRFVVEAGARGDAVTLQRSEVARVIWLHPENLSAPWKPPRPAEATGLLVESLTGDTSRLRLWATAVRGSVLDGVNSAIGPCSIDLESTSRLIIGGSVEPSTKAPFSQWRLVIAPDPRNLPPRRRAGDAPPADIAAEPGAESPAAPAQSSGPGPAAEAELLAAADRLAASRDRRAVAAYARLLTANDREVRSRSIGRLRAITGISLPFGTDEPAGKRDSQAAAWRRWAAQEAVSASLRFPDAEAAGKASLVGRVLVCRHQANDVVEYDENGEETFRAAVPGPWACDVTADGHRLVGSYGAQFIVEFDETGKEVGRIADLESGVMSVRRLENGHTLATLSDANKVVEFDPQGGRVWEVTLAGRPCDARRLPDGRTLVALHKANRIVEVDEQGKQVWAVERLPDPQTAQRLPNGNTLVALTVPGIIREIDRDGGEVWSRGGFEVLVDAQRLPDGRTLLLEQDGTRIELDADGNEQSRTEGGSGSRLHAY
jgi:hypothetical protein